MHYKSGWYATRIYLRYTTNLLIQRIVSVDFLIRSASIPLRNIIIITTIKSMSKDIYSLLNITAPINNTHSHPMSLVRDHKNASSSWPLISRNYSNYDFPPELFPVLPTISTTTALPLHFLCLMNSIISSASDAKQDHPIPQHIYRPNEAKHDDDTITGPGRTGWPRRHGVREIRKSSE